MSRSVTVHVRIFAGPLDLLTEESSYKSARAAARRVQDRSRELAPRRTGRGARSIEVRVRRTGKDGTWFRVGPSEKYMEYQEKGTGPVRARPGGVLRFQSGSGVFIFRPRTRGVRARHFMRDALRELHERDFKPE